MEEWSERCNIVDFEGGERDHEPRNVWPLEARKRKETDFPLEPPERNIALLAP